MRPWVIAALAVSLTATAAPARTMQQKLDAACSDDAKRLCPEAGRDGDRLKACMLAHRSEVGQVCMALIDASE